MINQELLYQIALTLIPGIGDINGKRLLAYCGSAEAVFKAKHHELVKIPGIGSVLVNNILHHTTFKRAENEILFIEKNEIQPLFLTHPNYPARLKECEDGPMLLFYKGNADFNKRRFISVIGTRKMTNYGRAKCEEIITGLSRFNITVVSGLAYGVDSCAHKSALDCGLQTIGVLAHGIDLIYPPQNRKLAESMFTQGGLLTEFISGTKPEREYFPRRNRIVAGLSDATLVIESDKKGGAMITAEIANSYNRDVFALPGRVGDDVSRGCNFLIKTNRAALVESADDIAYQLGWEDIEQKVKPQPELFLNLSDDENTILEIIRKAEEIEIDQLVINSKMTTSKVAAALLNLEFQGIVQRLPGKKYTA
ncbi:MAG TPA: DNA-processing protein DprA [Bacteroidales bacterium]